MVNSNIWLGLSTYSISYARQYSRNHRVLLLLLYVTIILTANITRHSDYIPADLHDGMQKAFILLYVSVLLLFASIGVKHGLDYILTYRADNRGYVHAFALPRYYIALIDAYRFCLKSMTTSLCFVPFLYAYILIATGDQLFAIITTLQSWISMLSVALLFATIAASALYRYTLRTRAIIISCTTVMVASVTVIAIAHLGNSGIALQFIQNIYYHNTITIGKTTAISALAGILSIKSAIIVLIYIPTNINTTGDGYGERLNIAFIERLMNWLEKLLTRDGARYLHL